MLSRYKDVSRGWFLLSLALVHAGGFFLKPSQRSGCLFAIPVGIQELRIIVGRSGCLSGLREEQRKSIIDDRF